MKEIGTCKECRYWIDTPLSRKTLLKNVLNEHHHKMRFCPITDQKIWANVWGEMKFGVMATMPDFGCIHWEEKE